MSVKEVYLEGNPPWGFRMNGGADAGHPLRISRVNPGSKAEAKGVREGDLITSINGQSTKCLTNSESHALLRTVKENLLLGLNEEKNASPRRRSREIKSASIISQEKERSESPAQPKGNFKPSASQKRHQRRTRLKQRIKDILGFKTKEKKEPTDEGWVIVDTALHGQDTHSVSELDTDEENRCNPPHEKEDTITNDSEEIYDNFEFKKIRESSHSPTSTNTTPLIMRKDQNQLGYTETVQTKEEKVSVIGFASENKFDSIESLPDYKNVSYSPSTTIRNSNFHDKKNTINFLENERNISEPKELWMLRCEEPSEQSANEACVCEEEGVSETLKTLPPSDMVEICNATIMIQDDNLAEELHVPLAVPEDDKIQTARTNRNLNPDYEPIEVNSSIIYPPYSSTLNYYFPQRRFLEAISEENSDLSESNEEKQDKSDKPWENSELIKQANNIAAIPNDWFGSDEGIDTSWRDGKSIEEVSDVAIVSDSFSDSDLISEDHKITRGVGEDGIIRYNINKSKSNESSSVLHANNKQVKVLGKPPIQTHLPNKMDIKSQNQQHDKIIHINKVSGQKNVDEKLPKAEMLKEYSFKGVEKKSTSVGSKVTCKILKHDEITPKESSKSIVDKTKIIVSSDNHDKTSSDQQIPKQSPDLKPQLSNPSKVSCKIIERTDVQPSSPKLNEKPAKILDDNSSANSSPNINKKSILVDSNKTKSSSQEKKYMKTTPSSGVLKHVVFSYYNGSKDLKKTDGAKNHEKKIETKETPQQNNEEPEKKAEISNNSSIELCKEVINPCTEKDIELVYIDSSDSDAFSNLSNLSARTSSIFEKEEPIILDENVSKKENCSQSLDNNKNLIINKEMININQSVKEISDVCSLNSVEKNNMQSCTPKHKSFKLKESIPPNVLSPVLCRKSAPNLHLKKRRFSYPMSEQDLLKKCSEVSCFNCSATISPTLATNEVKDTSNKVLSSTVPIKELKSKDSPVAIRKLSLRSLPSTPSPNNLSFSSSKYENQSFESIALEFSDGSVSSESYTLPDIAQDNDLSDVSTDTIKYFHITDSPKVVRRNPIVASEIVDLHKKFVERRGYHEASPVLKAKNEKGIEKTPEPDLIALSKCKERSEQSYTPELLAEAANLLALHKYHESRQRKMKSERKDETKSCIHIISSAEKQPERLVVENKHKENVKEGKKLTDLPTEIGMNEKIIEYKQVNKSESTENETVGKSRLLELFQKLDSKSSTTECTSESEPFPYWLLLGDNVDLENINELSQKSVVPPKSDKEGNTSEKSSSDDLNQECPESDLPSSEVLKSDSQIKASLVVLSSLPPGEILNRKMYEEYLGKMAELSERRNMKIIKVSTVPSTVCLPVESQPLESEFMNKVKERNEKLGIVIDEDESDDKTTNVKANIKDELPKHLKELMEITEECGGVWSPAQTPEAERKKFDFSNELKEEREREKQREEEERSEPSPAVWTPRSAGASPTVERKFRSVNFQSPTPSRKEFKTSNETRETPELPKELPIETEKDSKSRLISSSSENSTLSSSLRLPAAQNPTITLLQKAREGHIPRGAQYLEEQPAVGPNEIIYSVKKEHVSEDQSKKIVELGPRKIEGIGPTTKEGIPIVLRSEVKEDNQQRWYKRMYDSLHKAEFDSHYPYSSYSGGYSSEPERIGYDSDTSLSKYATLDRRKIRNKENDFTTSTMPRNRYGQGVNYAVNVYKNQPGRIEDYEPGNSSISDKETKKWWDEVMDIFDGDLNESKSNHHPSKVGGKPFTYSLKDAGYESDSTLVFRRRENNMSGQLLSPTEQKMAYKVIQKGGEVPFQGLRKAAPERPKESPHRYVESEVNIHYKSPVRREAKAAWPEDELAQRQAEIMRRIYQEQKRTKYLNELHDMYSRRHTDNLLPSQKSPIPLNRYDDFPVEVQPPRPRDRTPEPKLVARALYNFVGQTSRELSFRRGDIIYVRRQIDRNWYEGEHNAMIGLFPFNYVEIIPYDGIRTLPKKANEGQARAKFNFQAQTHLELSLVKGELVLLTRRVDENWFEGRIGNRKGIFPVSYVEVLVEPGERPETPSSGNAPTKPIVAPASHSVLLNGAKDLGQQHYQPPRPTIYSSSSLPPSSKIHDISLVNETLHIDTQSDPVPYRVMYNYRPQNEDELELKEGDIVYVMEKCDDGWYVGSLHRNGQFGTFPGNYVERIQ